jgi:hypothetical protein
VCQRAEAAVTRDTKDVAKSAFDMLVANRGGFREHCDFCGNPFTRERYPVPEEGRAWACNECEARWLEAEKRRAEDDLR